MPRVHLKSKSVKTFYLSSCWSPAWLCVWREVCRTQLGRQRKKAHAGWCHSRPVSHCCPGYQCTDGSRGRANPDRPAQYWRAGTHREEEDSRWQQVNVYGHTSAFRCLCIDSSTHITGMNLARARKLPRYPTAAWRITAGWETFCRIFHKWSRKASARAWNKQHRHNAYTGLQKLLISKRLKAVHNCKYLYDPFLSGFIKALNFNSDCQYEDIISIFSQ